MKFAAVVVLFALALGVNASVIPLPISLVHGPLVYHAAPHGSVAVHASAVPVVHSATVVHAAPVHIVHEPVHVEPVVHVVPAEGTYVAKTRGAVHVAPLPGHSQSASSINLEPAPGTH